MSEKVEALRSRVEELETEIGELEDALRRAPDKAKKWRVEAQRDLDASVDEEVLEDIVSLLRRRFSALGEVELIGRMMSWTLKPNASAGVTRMVQVTVTPRGTGTRVRIVDDLQIARQQRIAGYSVGLGMLGFGAAAAVAAGIMPALMPLALVAPVITHQLGKRSMRKLEEKRREDVDALMGEIAQLVGELATTAAKREEE